jgi:V8-like Glu-specific endopeptidase
MLVVDATFTTWARMGKEAKPGDVVFLWGQPAFLYFMYREGHVSGYDDKDGKVTTIYDVNGYPGDSGSGIFNLDGEVTAVTSYAIVVNYNGIQFKLMGSIPFKFTAEQYREVGYGTDHQ